jgi:catechol 2,3-dioxygenase-like lactoylglutathione lyase family enzyme
MNRVNFVTLGTKDLNRSKRFFRDLFGWIPTKNDSNDIAFFDMGGWILSLFPWDHLAEDAAVSPEGSGFPGITIAHNVRTKEEVASVLKKAESLGAQVVKPAQDVFWGGHSGYFRDLDGHFWEVAWNPFNPVRADGTIEVQSEP